MSVADELDKLRATLPACTLVAFGDLDARIVLCASASDRRPQEELDALCLTASAALDGPLAQSLSSEPTTGAVSVAPGEVRVFLRSDVEAQDALFCIFADQTDIGEMMRAGRDTLHRISALQ